MAVLNIPNKNTKITDAAEISKFLAQYSIWYRYFAAIEEIPQNSSDEEVLQIFAAPIAELKKQGGYTTADVINITPDIESLQVMLDKFNKEHWHDEDEVRFIVEGRGLFHINPGNDDEVFSIEMVKGDMINVPRGTYHWFDLCKEQRVRAIRLFQQKSGWTPHYTDSQEDQKFQPLCFGPEYIANNQRETTVEYQAVLTDIEGTTTPISFVHQTLFPYARKRLGSILHMDNNEINAALNLLREEFAQDKQPNRPQDFGDGIGYLEYLMEHDVKSTALKKIQGILWHDGYVCGELKSDIYDDVVVALKEWKQKGIVVKVFSSGSVLAQKLLFGHSNHGDLLEYFAGFHDTTTGPKKEKESYMAIRKQFGLPAQKILFLSDVVAELDAAREAGMQTGLFVRPGNKPVVANDHPSYDDFRKLL